MDGQGGSVVPYAVPGVAFRFPAWSPDRSRIAAIGQSPGGSGMIDVFTARSTGPGQTDPPIIYQSPDRLPFYLYWRPDGRSLTFLTVWRRRRSGPPRGGTCSRGPERGSDPRSALEMFA